ncbi:MAG: hypothetical protein HKL80_01690 [Acidimicrobiales bacterium]|nr:hypothetical protein [Acidimicrobiales bacterium]
MTTYENGKSSTGNFLDGNPTSLSMENFNNGDILSAPISTTPGGGFTDKWFNCN